MANARNKKAGGLDMVRTLAGRGGQSGHLPYRVYMKLASLELQRHRHLSERENALRRIEILERQIRAIEAEQDVVLKGVSQKAGVDAKDLSGVAPRLDQDVPSTGSGGFKFRY